MYNRKIICNPHFRSAFMSLGLAFSQAQDQPIERTPTLCLALTLSLFPFSEKKKISSLPSLPAEA